MFVWAPVLKSELSLVHPDGDRLDRSVTRADPTLRDRSADLGVRPRVDSKWSGAGVSPFGDDVLHSPTIPIEEVDDAAREVASYMVEVMAARHGIGLAANQVGLPWRMFVHNMPRVAPQVIINPTLVDVDDHWTYVEGCLSLTIEGTHEILRRPKRIVVKALDISGREVRIAADELLARVFQHEIDHLDGIVYVQRLIGKPRETVYGLMAEHGVHLTKLPPRPYGATVMGVTQG